MAGGYVRRDSVHRHKHCVTVGIALQETLTQDGWVL